MEYASALIGIIAFGLEVVEKVHRIIETVKEAPEQLQVLENRAHDVEFVLLQLKQAYQSGHLDRLADGHYLIHLCHRSEEQLHKVQRFLDQVVVQTHNGGDTRVAKLKWLMRHSQFKELLDRLDELVSSFTAIMTFAIA